MKPAQLRFDQTSDARFQLIGIDRKIKAVNFSEFSHLSSGLKCLAAWAIAAWGIWIGNFNKRGFQVWHGRRGPPEIFCLIRVRTVQDGGSFVADQESDRRDKMVDPDRYDAQAGRRPLAVALQSL